LRIATGVVQGLAFGADLPVVPVSTLAALAQQFSTMPLSFVAMDARIGEVFWGVYERNVDGLVEVIGEEVVAHVNDLIFPLRHAAGVGSGWAVYENELSAHTQGWVLEIEHDVLPQASTIATLGVHGFHEGRVVCAEDAQPVYLRDKVAQTEIERKNAKLNAENTR
jgi:tRNA threonylcarbamoyladenosine biosynthesis protein TsaB